MKKRILILYTNYGTGHYMAAKTIADELGEKAEVLLLDPLTFGRPIINRIFRYFGKLFSTKLRVNRDKLYKEKMYKNYLKKSKFAVFCTKLFWTKKLQRKIENFNPNLIVSTQVGPTILIADHKKSLNAKLVSIFTDYGLHRWYVFPHKNIDLFCVPSLEIKNEMMCLGIGEDKIKVTGIPVSKEFSINSFDRVQTLNKYELDKNKPIFLFVCGGGLGYTNGFSYFETLLKLKEDFSYIFISGSNKKLYNTALNLAKKHNKDGIVLGYVNNMAELINVSDLVIGKPGGILTSETITMSKSFCAIEPIPGQEEKNAKFLLNNNFGFFPHNKEEFKRIIKKVFKNRDILNNFKNNISKYNIQNSAHIISELCLK
jgi:processive 1,2-diacylglycerol beta-glucosyltransferase